MTNSDHFCGAASLRLKRGVRKEASDDAAAARDGPGTGLQPHRERTMSETTWRLSTMPTSLWTRA
jgi:hypothetical protein